MIALSEDENLMTRLFRFRFDGEGDLHGHSFGNLFLTAMNGITGDFAEAVHLTSEVLAIKGVIYPSTNTHVSLKARFSDDTWVEGETRITSARKRIAEIHLSPPDAQPLADALQAIASADVITLGPGSLYTSLIPNLLVNKMIDAVEQSPAQKIYIQNIMTQPGETDGLTVADHIEALMRHCSGKLLFPRVLLNTTLPSFEIFRRYHAEGADFVRLDRERLDALGIERAECNLLAEDGVIRHDPDLLGRAIYRMVGLD
jgi:uncharacterized cofD-like protein